MSEDFSINYISPVTGQAMHEECVESTRDGRIEEGMLVDASGKHHVPVRGGIPRFEEDEDYTDKFGEQWNRYREVQIDRENNFSLSADRLYKWTGWTREELAGQSVLEAGCGAGRFSQVLLEAGAELYAFDLSSAVDACRKTTSAHPRLHLSQASIYDIPYAGESFDRVFCFGVLQHTPDPRKAFLSLVKMLKKGGRISIDSYVEAPRCTRWTSKYIWRPITTRMSAESLFKLIEWYIPKWLPIDNFLAKIPFIGRRLVGIIPCWNYTGIFDLTPEQIVQWAILDTFDALAPKYDFPQTKESVRQWFDEAGLTDIQVTSGSNGIVGNARKP